MSPHVSPPAFGAGSAHVVPGSNRVIPTPHVALIFWGSYWAGVPAPQPGRPAPPDLTAVVIAATELIKAQFFAALSEYGVGPFQEPVQWTQVSGAGLPPSGYGDTDIRAVILSAIGSGAFKSPQDCTVYCVITGPDAPPPHDVDLSDLGYHQAFASGGQPVVYAYVRGQYIPGDGTFDGSLGLITMILAHELAEAVTDPFLDAYRDPALPLGEIGDICGGFYATVGNVDVAPYWSQAQNLCVTGGAQVRQKHSGFCIQNSWHNPWGMPGPFELFVAPQQGSGLVRWRRYNTPQNPIWQSEDVSGPLAWSPGATFGPPAVLQTRHGLIGFGAGALWPNQQYEFMTLFRVAENVWYADVGGSDLRTQPVGLVGRPAIIQSDIGNYGNYEAVLVLTDGSINHYSRDNDGQYNWNGPFSIPITAAKHDARVALLQASFQSSLDSNGDEVWSGGAPGSFHVVVQTGGQLYHAVYTAGEWAADTTLVRPPHQKPRRVLSPISANGRAVTNCVGTPGLIETRQGQQQRNFQLVVAKTDGSIEHYARQNDASPFTWRLVSAFAVGDAVADVSLLQSTFPGSPLEVIGITQGGRAIVHYQQRTVISPRGVHEGWTKETVPDPQQRLWKI